MLSDIQFNLLIPKLYLLLIFLSFSIVLSPSLSAASNYQKVTFETEDGARIECSFFEARKTQAVVFAHGAVFNKESWYLLAEGLQKEGVSSLVIDFRGYGNSLPGKSKDFYHDVLGAVDYLEKRGFENIALVGGSMGGAAILRALGHKVNPRINKVVLLAPAGGEAIKNKTIKKLFIVTKGDRFYSGVYTMFTTSSDPKELKVYPGTSHAQHIFKTEAEVDLTNLIITFLKDQQ
jgi:alpha-beta hydrolase superfamily lysophospholipase